MELGRVRVSRDWYAAVGQCPLYPPKADIRQRIEHVCFVPKANVDRMPRPLTVVEIGTQVTV